ncbi:hypothetical protein MXB_126 [Myxobolus squamalis]|nr:hypothetical protein MXB_126 [Myxobolus squamalis]
MSKLVLCVFIINVLIILYKFNQIYQNEQNFFSSFTRYCESKMGVATINSAILMLLYCLSKVGTAIFFGKLRPFEFERIKERIWYAVTDTLLAFAIFSSDLSSNVMLSLCILLFLKYFHFTFEVRVGSIERDILIPKRTIIKKMLFFIFFLTIDAFFAYYLGSFRQESDSLENLMVNEYVILSINLAYNMSKLTIHYIDYIKDYSFQAKTITHTFFLVTTIVLHGVLPILFVRPLMASKLPCGHMFHVQCLKAWFQRQQTCPTCRLDILSMINKSTTNSDPPKIEPVRAPQPPKESICFFVISLHTDDGKFSECNCIKCGVFNGRDCDQLTPDPRIFMGIPNAEYSKNIDPNHVNQALIINIQCNLESAIAQMTYLEERLASQHKG